MFHLCACNEMSKGHRVSALDRANATAQHNAAQRAPRTWPPNVGVWVCVCVATACVGEGGLVVPPVVALCAAVGTVGRGAVAAVAVKRTILRRIVEEVPDQNGVVVRTADDLELVELQPEHAAGVFL